MALQDRIGVTTVQGMAGGVPLSVDIGVAPFPLPAGAATEAKQDAQTALLTTINASAALSATAARQDTGNASLSSIHVCKRVRH